MSTAATRPAASGHGRTGFRRAAALVEDQLRNVGAARGFTVSRLLTHWAEVAGTEIAAIATPVSVGYGRGGIGATLTLLVRGAAAPLLQAQLPVVRERVNACYGYNAVTRIKLTQTAASGFGEATEPFARPAQRPAPGPASRAAAAAAAGGISDPTLRDALTALGAEILLAQEKRGPTS